jgi:hypothetical protein
MLACEDGRMSAAGSPDVARLLDDRLVQPAVRPAVIHEAALGLSRS